MDQTVNIPFSIRLEAGESGFQINIDKKYADNPNRLFGFSTVTLTPDYYSRQAFQLDLDSEAELKAAVEHDFYIEEEVEQNAFDKHPYSSTAALPIQTVLRTINKHFEQHKPDGFHTPLLAFDWIHVNALSPTVDKEEFYKTVLTDMYEEAFDESQRSQDISSMFKNIVDLNDLPFPTKSSAYEDIRIRLTLAPNVTVAFSNTALPSALGFDDTQYTLKANKQFKIQNISGSAYKTVICYNEPTLANIVYNTVIHTYPTSKFVLSNTGTLSTTKEKERKPSLLANDYNTAISQLAKKMNLDFTLVHDATGKKFTLVYPDATGVQLNLRVPTYISHKLGYGHVSVIKPHMHNDSYPEEVEIKNVEAIAKVLAYDTGMVVISLDQQASKQTHQFTNLVMAILESDDAGVMTTKTGLEFSKVPISYFNPNLQFELSRFNENNQPMPLGWKVGAYIRGVLVGKV